MNSLEKLAATIASRKGADPETSWTAKLLAKGPEKCAEKFGEEAVEAIIEAVKGDRARLTSEAADVLYHLLVMLAARDVTLAEVLEELDRREGMRLRNTLVRPFGLKTGEPDRPIFPTCHETENELILGTDDRHLNFRIGLIRAEGRLYMSTWVHPHNLWGRAYLRLVMPFHILISRGAVARMAIEADRAPVPNP